MRILLIALGASCRKFEACIACLEWGRLLYHALEQPAIRISLLDLLALFYTGPVTIATVAVTVLPKTRPTTRVSDTRVGLIWK